MDTQEECTTPTPYSAKYHAYLVVSVKLICMVVDFTRTIKSIAHYESALTVRWAYTGNICRETLTYLTTAFTQPTTYVLH